jgi:hypothetical protein
MLLSLAHAWKTFHVRAALVNTINQPHLRHRNLHLQACISQPQQAVINSSGFSDERTGWDMRGNLQPFVRNGLPSAVASRTADHHGIGLGFEPCSFAGQPLHVMKFINLPECSGLLRKKDKTRAHSTKDCLPPARVKGFSASVSAGQQSSSLTTLI